MVFCLSVSHFSSKIIWKFMHMLQLHSAVSICGKTRTIRTAVLFTVYNISNHLSSIFRECIPSQNREFFHHKTKLPCSLCRVVQLVENTILVVLPVNFYLPRTLSRPTMNFRISKESGASGLPFRLQSALADCCASREILPSRLLLRTMTSRMSTSLSRLTSP